MLPKICRGEPRVLRVDAQGRGLGGREGSRRRGLVLRTRPRLQVRNDTQGYVTWRDAPKRVLARRIIGRICEVG